MPRVTYRSPGGGDQTIDVPVGWSVMDGAVKNGVEGILAECGGSCACATCHVFVDADWFARLPPASEMEQEMLACTAEPARATSRLSCQVQLGPELDGLRVTLPERQS
jgi:ferredoxin, 2Fe-2S